MDVSYRWNAIGYLERLVGDERQTVRAKACLPGREDSPLSIRDSKDEEIELVSAESTLDPESRSALARDLREQRFSIRVERIVEIHPENDLRIWHVMGLEGPRRFVTALEEWPLPRGDGYSLRDAWGDLYEIPAWDRLDERSQKLLWPLLG